MLRNWNDIVDKKSNNIEVVKDITINNIVVPLNIDIEN